MNAAETQNLVAFPCDYLRTQLTRRFGPGLEPVVTFNEDKETYKVKYRAKTKKLDREVRAYIDGFVDANGHIVRMINAILVDDV